MSGHSRWSTVKDRGELSEALGGRVAVENMTQYCQGYILALDDLLQEIDGMKYDTESMDGREYPDGYHDALVRIRYTIKVTMDSAQRTLRSLQKKVDGAE